MTQPLALPNYSALGSIVTEDLSHWKAGDALREAGWTFAGDGAETTVYRSPDGSRVVKLIRDSFSGNAVTIAVAEQHPDNPHLPRVYGTLGFDHGGLAVETEALDKGSGLDASQFRKVSRLASFGEYGQPPVRRTRSALNLMPCGPLKEATIALADAALDFEGTTGTRYLWDLHGGNVMFRPGTHELVLNDLIYAG